jgi:tRNA-splicing ligase RtcB
LALSWNYVVKERHFGKDDWLPRKGAVRAGAGELGIIPGSMGAKSFIVRGKGNANSFETSSHGAGRAMSRQEAKHRFTLEDHARATAHVDCRKDEGVIDKTPGPYEGHRRGHDGAGQPRRDRP